MTRWLSSAVFMVSFVATAAAQAEMLPLRLNDSLLNLPTARVLPAKVWEVRFTHRFSEPINQGDSHSLWGLDSAADVGIGLAWSPAQNMQVSLFRNNVQDDVEGAFKYAFLRQSTGAAFSLASRGGFDWRTERGLDDRFSLFVQGIVSYQLLRNLELFAVPTYVSNAAVFDHAFNIPLGLAFAIKPNVNLIAELIPQNQDLPDNVKAGIGWSIGLERAIGGHFFEVVLTDTRATHVDQYTTGAFLGGIRERDVHLGFNIERQFGGE
ncbi:MAG TPA: DUF5777 family beta-barrel protein [Thermoanaerobaculia bacterium]|nr:DUF5777 family beta-barrel protein [Thermoanaerobaculia bacterium]